MLQFWARLDLGCACSLIILALSPHHGMCAMRSVIAKEWEKCVCFGSCSSHITTHSWHVAVPRVRRSKQESRGRTFFPTEVKAWYGSLLVTDPDLGRFLPIKLLPLFCGKRILTFAAPWSRGEVHWRAVFSWNNEGANNILIVDSPNRDYLWTWSLQGTAWTPLMVTTLKNFHSHSSPGCIGFGLSQSHPSFCIWVRSVNTSWF